MFSSFCIWVLFLFIKFHVFQSNSFNFPVWVFLISSNSIPPFLILPPIPRSWSKIAQHLPGRTDNEIKNYWRTRVQKHAKQLKCDVNSKQFKDTMRYLWMPRLVERIRAASAVSGSTQNTPTTLQNLPAGQALTSVCNDFGVLQVEPNTNITPENSSTDSFATTNTHVVSPISDLTDYYFHGNHNGFQTAPVSCSESLLSPSGSFYHGFELPPTEQNVWFGMDPPENTWNMEDIWLLQQQQQQMCL